MRFEARKLPRVLEGVVYTENAAADQIENIFGVTFVGAKPKKVTLDEFNIDAIQRFHKRLATRLELPQFPPFGRYLPGINHVFLAERARFGSIFYAMHTDFHENCHAYSVQMKPSLFLYPLKAKKVGSRDQLPEYIKQRVAAYSAFRESIADWVATEARLRMQVIDIEANPQFSHEGVKAVIADNVRQTGKGLWDAMAYEFVDSAVRFLYIQGFSQGEALNTLIKNPPHCGKNLLDPVKYSQSLLRTI